MTKVTIVYETRSGNTDKMKQAIEEGLKENGAEVVSKKIKDANPVDFAEFDAVVLGSPTYHHDLIPSMKKFLFKMEKVDLKGKVGASFGSFGWSGESVGMLNDTMKHIFEMEVIEPGLKIKRKPDKDGLKKCKEFGKQIAEKAK